MLADLKKKETIRLDLGALNSHTLNFLTKPCLSFGKKPIRYLIRRWQPHKEAGFHGR